MKKDLCLSPEAHYTADACIVWCFDNRFSNAFENFKINRGMKHYDLISVAGGALTLASPANKGFDFLLGQIEASIRLHHAKKIILMMHQDCGACGGSKAFPNKNKEVKKIKQNLGAARKNVSSFSVPIETIFVDFKDYYKLF